MPSRAQLFATPWTIACQAPLSMEFFRQEYWSALPFPSPGDLSKPGIEPASPAFLALAGRLFTTSTTTSQNSFKNKTKITERCVKILFQWLYYFPSLYIISWDFPGKNPGLHCHFLLQGIFLTQGFNLHLLILLHCRWLLYHWAWFLPGKPDFCCYSPQILWQLETRPFRESQ